MPIVLSNNNRVLPANSRSVDVAQATINRLIPIQNRRYDNAFRVQGFQGILYHRLNSGEKCSCKTRANTVHSLLNEEGVANPGIINQLLSGGQEFGYRRYGSKTATVPSAVLSVALPTGTLPPVKLPSMFETDDQARTDSGVIFGTMTDRYSDDPNQAGSSTITPDGFGVNGPVNMGSEMEDLVNAVGFDLGLNAHSDTSCPICFGTGFVGGFSVYNGWRKVLVPQTATTMDGSANLQPEVPDAQVVSISWAVKFPTSQVGVDSFAVYNSDSIVTSGRVYVDGSLILSPLELLNYCDGKDHQVALEFDELTTFTHVELQLDSSSELANFEFPKLTKGSTQTLLENTDPFSITCSPLIPRISPLDVVAESTYGKRLQVKSVPTWNDRSRSVLGWEAEVRPTQPQELFRLLPVRRRIETSNRPAFVRGNLTGSRRT